MAQTRHHYERAFASFLRARRIPFVSVNEARQSLLPPGAALTVSRDGAAPETLKSFDFVVYGDPVNLLLELKGRKIPPPPPTTPPPPARSAPGQSPTRVDEIAGDAAAEQKPRRPRRGGPGTRRTRLESWVTEADVQSLATWQRLFGEGFEAWFVFVYWCEDQPPDALFQEVFEHEGRWYAPRAVRVDEYAAGMKPRSRRWRTVSLPARVFERISHPFAPTRTAQGLATVPGMARSGLPASHEEPPDPPALQPHEAPIRSAP